MRNFNRVTYGGKIEQEYCKFKGKNEQEVVEFPSVLILNNKKAI
jgi:hypothetical protein